MSVITKVTSFKFEFCLVENASITTHSTTEPLSVTKSPPTTDRPKFGKKLCLAGLTIVSRSPTTNTDSTLNLYPDLLQPVVENEI